MSIYIFFHICFHYVKYYEKTTTKNIFCNVFSLFFILRQQTWNKLNILQNIYDKLWNIYNKTRKKYYCTTFGMDPGAPHPHSNMMRVRSYMVSGRGRCVVPLVYYTMGRGGWGHIRPSRPWQICSIGARYDSVCKTTAPWGHIWSQIFEFRDFLW